MKGQWFLFCFVFFVFFFTRFKGPVSRILRNLFHYVHICLYFVRSAKISVLGFIQIDFLYIESKTSATGTAIFFLSRQPKHQPYRQSEYVSSDSRFSYRLIGWNAKHWTFVMFFWFLVSWLFLNFLFSESHYCLCQTENRWPFLAHWRARYGGNTVTATICHTPGPGCCHPFFFQDETFDVVQCLK